MSVRRIIKDLATWYLEGLGSQRIPAAHVAHYSCTPGADTAVKIHAAVALTGEAQTVTTGITQPDVPRVLCIKGNQADMAGDVVITGTDMAGNTVSDTIALNGVAAVDGVVAFKTVSQFTLPALTTAGDTVSIGDTDKLGLPHCLTRNTLLSAHYNNTLEAVAATVVCDSDEVSKNTIDLNTALAGERVDVYYLAESS